MGALAACGGAGRPPISADQVYTAFLHHGFVLQDNPVGTDRQVIHSYLVPGPGLKMYGGIDVYASVHDAVAIEPDFQKAYGRKNVVARANVIVQFFGPDATGKIRRKMLRALTALR